MLATSCDEFGRDIMKISSSKQLAVGFALGNEG